MNDRHFRRPIASILSLRALLLVLGLAVLFAAAMLWRGPMGSIASDFEGKADAARAGFSGWLGGIASVLASKAALVRENEELKAELSHAQALIADREILARENAELKARMGRSSARTVILAGVIARPPGLPYDTLLIDAGSEEGVNSGDTVSAGGGMAIGTVVEVFAKRARAALYSSPGVQYQGLLKGSVELTVEGNGGGSFSGRVPAVTPIETGDELLLPGIGGGLMGEVSGIVAPEGDSFKTLYFRLPINIFELQFVEVWK